LEIREEGLGVRDYVPVTIEELQAAVRDCPPGARLLVRGTGTKPALSSIPNSQFPISNLASPIAAPRIVVSSSLRGVLEYEPSEFTFTALAGTPAAEVQALLSAHGQYLPFDPPLAERGATLGGAIAAGLSGPGRYRYGGARDFLLGVRYVDGEGCLVRAGGKVVKNAAGFDIPKLMVGSLGAYGVLAELSFKVFPQPEAYASLQLVCSTAADAVQAVYRLGASQLDLDSLDLEAANGAYVLWARLAGLEAALPARLHKLRALLGGGAEVAGADEAAVWRSGREFEWAPPGWALIKAPITPARIQALEEVFAGRESRRRYSAGAQVLWLATPEPLDAIGAVLAGLNLPGLVLWGPPGPVRLGRAKENGFARRVKQALDPRGRFVYD
jgi:glycolate oxidase FAD binding subunit